MSLAVELPHVQSGCSAPSNCADVEALHREFYARLVKVCTTQLHDRSLAEDVAQDTILRALRFWSSYDSERPTWPWLKTIALHLCLDARRLRSHEVCLEAMPDRAESVDRTERLIDEITVRRAMAGLPERQRLALRLRYFDDRDRDASAQELGVNVNAFDQLLNRARLRLARVIEPARAGGPLGLLVFPLRWLRSRSSRKAAGSGGAAGVALGTMTTVPLAVAPLLAIVAGMAPAAAGVPLPAAATFALHPSHAGRAPAANVVRTSRPAVRTVRGGGSAFAVGVAAGPAKGHITVAKHPLGNGHVQSHWFQVVTPVVTVTIEGYGDHDSQHDLLCKLPVGACS